MDPPNDAKNPERRAFVKKAAAVVAGGLAATVPVGAGFSVFFSPLRRKVQIGSFVRVTSIDSLPADGVPRQFAVIADRSDAWNKSPLVSIGAVYLRRTGEKKVEALHVVCPHLGCSVDYSPRDKAFACPCHNSKFGLDGRIADKTSPSPRPLDSLEVEIRNETEVWVKFQNFLAGKEEKIPVS